MTDLTFIREFTPEQQVAICKLERMRFDRDHTQGKPPSDGFAKWEPVSANYVDPRDLHAAMFAQSARTIGGNVAEFRINHSNSEPAALPDGI